MPTAKKKIGALGLFTRHADGTVSGPPGSPRAGLTGLSATSPPTVVNHLQLQPAADIVASRSEQVASARLPLPLPKSGRFSNAAQQELTTHQSAHQHSPSQHNHHVPRTRTAVSEQGVRTGPGGLGGAWEDSTVDSLFDPAESKASSEVHRPQTLHGRQYSDITSRRPRPSGHTQPRLDEPLHPFVINDIGLMKVVSPPLASPPGIGALNTSLSNGLLIERPSKPTEFFEDERRDFETTPTRIATLRRTKLPHRDTRDIGTRNSFSEKLAGYPPEINVDELGMSPGNSSENNDERLERLRTDEITRRRLEAKRERDLKTKRSTVFESLTPVEDPAFNDTQAAVMPSSDHNSEGSQVDLTPDGTPRRVHQPVARDTLLREDRNVQRNSQQLSQRLAALNEVTQEPPRVRAARQPFAPPVNMLQESALARNNSHRSRDPAKKRRHSLDYNDAELDAMNFTDLQSQDFDFDPQAAALQQTGMPAAGTLEEKLEHYKGKDGIAQHQFFTHISVSEWDTAGDWFLDQFGAVMEKMKAARKEKRKVVSDFENEIATREEAVRGKIEGIEHTLSDLKEEGQIMMAGKDVEDLEF